ncbi:uncharacterized protein [Spinacia oleracea]|uniref:Retrotransposon gag domain-containing protein n=1 Tax=Spinacia oleracea TaxID=3562 RepID=A0ABM3RH94_SPIOL|nr:uncharacterized protein LOC130469611 [Spinacia oleracea]
MDRRSPYPKRRDDRPNPYSRPQQQCQFDESPLEDGKSGTMKFSKTDSKKDPSKWCDFHADIGHTTNECVAMRREFVYLLNNGHLKDVMSNKARGVVDKDTFNSPSKSPPPPPHTKTVNFTVEGSDVCGWTSSAAKRHARENEIDRSARAAAAEYVTPISFDESDAWNILDRHHDGIVISIPVGNCMIRRVLVDSGSSTNIMMLEALKEMGLNPQKDVTKKSTILALDSRHEGYPLDLPPNHQVIDSMRSSGNQRRSARVQGMLHKAALKPSATNKASL